MVGLYFVFRKLLSHRSILIPWVWIHPTEKGKIPLGFSGLLFRKNNWPHTEMGLGAGTVNTAQNRDALQCPEFWNWKRMAWFWLQTILQLIVCKDNFSFKEQWYDARIPILLPGSGKPFCGGLTLESSQTPSQPQAFCPLPEDKEKIEGRQEDLPVKILTV